MVTFTASREDFKLYFTCPRKLALKTIGVKVREVKPSPRLAPTYAIGLSGERLTEEILELIASLQLDESKGEYVKTLKEKDKIVKESQRTIVEAFRTGMLGVIATPSTLIGIAKHVAKGGGKISLESVEKSVKKIVDSTVSGAFKKGDKISSYDLKVYEEKLKKEMKGRFLNTLKEMLEKMPKIKTVYKPTLRNRDTCSIGVPDYQVETSEGHILIEVKNWRNLNGALREGKEDLLYYNSLLADSELGDSVWQFSELPKPVKSLIVIPRWGTVEEVVEPIPNFREIAVEIWKIKRAALVEGVLPEINSNQSICKRCQYKRFCEKYKSERLESTKPIPLIYAVARYESKVDETVTFKTPPGFWNAYFKLKRKAEEGDEKSKLALNQMDEYLSWLHMKDREERAKVLYKATPGEFDDWGGLEFLKRNYMKISNISNRLYHSHGKNVKLIIKIARKRWGI